VPLSKHFGGHGEKVMANMVRQYGSQRAKRIFYATENARKNDLDGEIGRTIKHMRRKHKLSRSIEK